MSVRLRQAGFDVVHTGEIGMAEASDKEILQRAATEKCVVQCRHDLEAGAMVSVQEHRVRICHLPIS